MAQLARGAGEALDLVLSDLRAALAYANDAYAVIKRNPDLARDQIDWNIQAIRDAYDRLDGDIRERLLRAEARRTLEARIAALEQKQ